MPHRGAILTQDEVDKRYSHDNQRRLPEVVCKKGEGTGGHVALSFRESFRSSCSASLTSSNVKCPAFTMCAITGLLPKSLSRSSINLPCARFLVTAASKILALPMRFTSRTAFLASMRVTMV